MTIGNFIINYRKEHSLSQRQFAAICSLSNGYISMLEKGINPKTKEPIIPSLPVYKKIADGIGVELNELLTVIDDSGVSLPAGNQKRKAPAEKSERNELIELFDQLTPKEKKIVLAQIKAFLPNK